MCVKPKMQLRLLREIQQELKATFYFTGAGNVLLTQQEFLLLQVEVHPSKVRISLPTSRECCNYLNKKIQVSRTLFIQSSHKESPIFGVFICF